MLNKLKFIYFLQIKVSQQHNVKLCTLVADFFCIAEEISTLLKKRCSSMCDHYRERISFINKQRQKLSFAAINGGLNNNLPDCVKCKLLCTGMVDKDLPDTRAASGVKKHPMPAIGRMKIWQTSLMRRWKQLP